MASSSSTIAKRRSKNPTKPAFPPRRSARIIKRKPFRFADLPPELRNRVYKYALQQDTGTDGFIPLTSGLIGAARALSQVSRIVRAESMGLFYAHNTFGIDMNYLRRLVCSHASAWRQLKTWANTWGELAAPHIRSITITGLCYHCSKQICFDLQNATATEQTEVLHRIGPYDWCSLKYFAEEADLRIWVQTVLRKTVEPKLKAYQIFFLLRGLGPIYKGFAGLSEVRKASILTKLQNEIVRRNGANYE